jgi:hypothetical protein
MFPPKYVLSPVHATASGVGRNDREVRHWRNALRQLSELIGACGTFVLT